MTRTLMHTDAQDAARKALRRRANVVVCRQRYLLVHLVQDGLRVDGEICPLREVLTQQSVGVLVAASLPRATWIAEVHRHVGGESEALVIGQLHSSVPSQGATQLSR